MKVQKMRIPVVLFTADHKLEGVYHSYEGNRLLDDLNARQKPFVPLTQVRVTDLQHENAAPLELDFLAVHVDHITFVAPVG